MWDEGGMIRKEKFMIAEYNNIELKTQDAVKVRGFFADIDQSDSVMHNHRETGENIYRYPMVQYKVLHHHPVIIAYADGINALYPKLMQIDTVNFGGIVCQDPELKIRLETRMIGDSGKRRRFRFLTPWLALNQDNYKKYMSLSEEDEQTRMLERILIGNILSLCKGFGVNLEQRIKVLTNLRQISARYKGEPMIGFLGEFEANVMLPKLCGIGKGVSRGMGTFTDIPDTWQQETKEEDEH